MFLASRFVAGKTAEDAIAVAQTVNAQGMNAILDYLGEDVKSAEAAQRAAEEYVRLMHLIHESKVRAAISLKVSQMGILISRDECLVNLRRIAAEAARLGIFVWLDMEGSSLTQKTIESYEVIHETVVGIGLCLQAYLVRTGGDLDHLMRNPFSVRLCKGAYKEPPHIAYAARAAVDGNFRMLAQKALQLAGRGVYPAFATHDHDLIEYVKKLVREKNVSTDQFEFQMLYGIQNKALQVLAKEGFRTSLYIPYGSHWLPYFIRRLRERKENVYFLMRNVFRA
jgi:proline dehydrogenase